MSVKTLLDENKLSEALVEAQSAVRQCPEDAALRAALFPLYAALGRWEKAATQCELLAKLQPSTAFLGQVYHRVLACEVERQGVLQGVQLPPLFGEPEAWMAPFLRAAQLAFQGQVAAATALRNQALEAVPAMAGRLNGRSFTALGDADPRFSFFLEAIVGGTYFWVPFTRIRSIQTESPENMRDTLWLPARFVWENDGEATGYLFARYPGSELSGDGAVALGRATDWVQQTDGSQHGIGQRMLATEAEDVALLDVRECVFESVIPGTS